MKSRLIVTSLVLVVGGCAAPNYREAQTTSGVLRATSEDATSAVAALDGTAASLRDLMRTDEGDLRPRYDAFSASVDGFADTMANLQKRAVDVSTAAGVYLDEWDRELQHVQNPELRSRSVDRKRSVDQAMAAVTSLENRAREQSASILSDLQDVRRVLGTDLTRGGLMTVELTATALEARIADLRDTSARLSDELAALSGDLSPIESRFADAKPAPAPAPEGITELSLPTETSTAGGVR